MQYYINRLVLHFQHNTAVFYIGAREVITGRVSIQPNLFEASSSMYTRRYFN